MLDSTNKVELDLGLLKWSVTFPFCVTRIVAQRFIQIFADHGVQRTQIPHFLPQVGLDALSSDEKLLSVLSTSVLDQTAELFGVRREWLDGISENIYACSHCYKAPERFFEDLRQCLDDGSNFNMQALTTTKELDLKGGLGQNLVLILLKSLKRTDNNEIYRYTVYGDVWDWSYAPCRIQFKAMARLVFQNTKCPVPLFKVSMRELENVREGLTVPRPLLEGCLLTDPSLEDYALSPDESGVARETEELEHVLKYIKVHGLEPIAHSLSRDN